MEDIELKIKDVKATLFDLQVQAVGIQNNVQTKMKELRDLQIQQQKEAKSGD
jgi:ribosomal protein L29